MMLARASQLPPVARLLPVLAWMGLIFALSARSTLPEPPGFNPSLTSILGHFSVYAVLAALVWWALGPGFPASRRIALAFGVACLYGLSDEWHQSFVPGRYPSAFDVLVDAIGAGTALALIWRATRQQSPQATDSRRRHAGESAQAGAASAHRARIQAADRGRATSGASERIAPPGE